LQIFCRYVDYLSTYLQNICIKVADICRYVNCLSTYLQTICIKVADICRYVNCLSKYLQNICTKIADICRYANCLSMYSISLSSVTEEHGALRHILCRGPFSATFGPLLKNFFRRPPPPIPQFFLKTKIFFRKHLRCLLPLSMFIYCNTV
jgi:hypothetical protein